MRRFPWAEIILLGSFLITAPRSSDVFLAPKSIFLVFAISLYLASTVFFRSEVIYPSILNVSVWGLLVTFSFVQSKDVFFSLNLACIGIAVLFLIPILKKIPLRHTIFCLIAVAVIQMIVGIWQINFTNGPTRFTHFPERLKFAGTLGNPQYVASFLGIVFCLVVFSNREILSTRWRIYLAGILGVGLLLTRMQATPLILILTCLACAQIKNKTILLCGLSLLVLAGMPFLHWHTLQGRLLLWLSALDMSWQTQFVGVGLGHYGNHYLTAQRDVLSHPLFREWSSHASFADHAHNEYLNLFSEVGFLAIGIFFLAFFKFKNITRSKPMAAVIVFTAIDACFSLPWRILPILVVVFFVLESGTVSSQPRQGNAIVAIIATMLFLISTAALIEQWYVSKAHKFSAAGNVPLAESFIDRALAINPKDPDLILFKGRMRYLSFDANGALDWARKGSSRGERIDLMKLEGLALRDLQRWDEAEKLYLKLASTLPEQVTAHFYLREVYLKRQQDQLANHELELLEASQAKNSKAMLDQWRANGRL